MNSKSPKPSEIVEAIFDFCEDEKDVAKMSIQEVDKALANYGINGKEVISKIKFSIEKTKAKSCLKEAATKRFEELKKISANAKNVLFKPNEISEKLSSFLNLQYEFVFRSFSNCPAEDLQSISEDLKVLDSKSQSCTAKPSYEDVNPKAIAYHLTQKFYISNPKEIDLEAIAMAEGILVLSGSLKGCDARLIRKGDKGVIRVNDDLPAGQKRFAIAHELGHWQMHQGISQWNLCTDENIANYNSSSPELQASAFASEFLMPTKLLRPLYAESEPNMELIKQVANDFDTGLTASALRFIELNEHPCMIVVSDGKHVRWWRKNDKCKNIWFQSNQPINERTLAARCCIGKNSLKGECVPFSAWFNHIDSSDRDTIYEQSMKLGNYNSILTLLWFD